MEIFTPGQELNIQPNDICLLCGKGTMKLKTNKITTLQFLGCTNYPRCKNTVSIENIKTDDKNSTSNTHS